MHRITFTRPEYQVITRLTSYKNGADAMASVAVTVAATAGGTVSGATWRDVAPLCALLTPPAFTIRRLLTYCLRH
eukprot:6178768-Pleurochrysis_carterae.AAC.1